MNQTQPILIWAFHEAPLEYQGLSTCDGDEDNLAFIPLGVEIPHFIEYGSGPNSFGYSQTDFYPVENGIVAIGCH